MLGPSVCGANAALPLVKSTKFNDQADNDAIAEHYFVGKQVDHRE